MESDSVSIIGGGPSGCTAAIFLAKNGFNVKLYERDLRKAKTCAGGISWRGVREFKLILNGLKMLPIKEVCFDIEGTKWNVKFEKYIGCVSDRLSFDKHLRKVAKKEGVKMINKNVSKLPKDELVIDARGFKPPKSSAFAMRGFWKTKKLEKMLFMFKKDLIGVGYFWIFPMNRNLANVGVGGFSKTFKKHPLSLLKWFSKEHGMRVYDISSAPIYLEGKIENLTDKNIIRVGEAGGLVNPLTAEGIYYAMKSGKIAAECISKGKIDEYEKIIKKTFENEFKVAKTLRHCLNLPPRIKISLFKGGLWFFKNRGLGLSSSLV